MRTSEHTSSPWGTDEHEHDSPYQDVTIRAGRRRIACVWMDDAPVEDFNREQRANVRLMVAAPNMLASLRRDLEFARNVVTFLKVSGETKDVLFTSAQMRVSALEQVIAKAEGRS